MENDVNRALLADWLDWLRRAGRWIAYGPPIQTPISFRRERLGRILAEGRLLSWREREIQILKAKEEA